MGVHAEGKSGTTVCILWKVSPQMQQHLLEFSHFILLLKSLQDLSPSSEHFWRWERGLKWSCCLRHAVWSRKRSVLSDSTAASQSRMVCSWLDSFLIHNLIILRGLNKWSMSLKHVQLNCVWLAGWQAGRQEGRKERRKIILPWMCILGKPVCAASFTTLSLFESKIS